MPNKAIRSITLVLLCGLAVGLTAKPAWGQTEVANEMAQLDAVGEKAADAVAAVREFFNDYRVQTAVVLILIVLGLTLWLLGARAGRLLFALLLGTAGVIPGMYVAAEMDLPLWPGALAGGLAGMLLGVFIFRIGIMLVGMAISTILALGIFTVIYMEQDDQIELRNAVQDCLVSAQEAEPGLEYTGTRMAFNIGMESNEASVETIKKLMDKYHQGLLITIVVGLAAGLLLQLFVSSFMLVLTTACVGTIMVLGGVWLGLAFRGQKPEETVGLKPVSSIVVFMVMLGLGMLVQLTMTRKRKETEAEEEDEE